VSEDQPPATIITIQGIRAPGRHGVDEAERDLAQEFVVDLQAWVRAASDTLDDTADYRTIVQHVKETVESTSFLLLESLAVAVAKAVWEVEPVLRANVVVHKPGAARSMGVADVSVEVTYPE